MKKLKDFEIYYQALLTRDAKFDGKFFVAVKTTGIYCRPICPAKPLRKNIIFFSTAFEAGKAGFRPCLRCRPESAPDSPLWHGTTSIVQRAVRALNDEMIADLNEDQFAEKFGMTARHLRRLFKQQLGKTPNQIRLLHRLQLARKLIVESNLPFIEIATSAGFNSTRRFNDAIQKYFAKNPTSLRKHVDKNISDDIELSLSYRPPFNWEECLDYYAKHRMGKLENFANDSYHRLFEMNDEIGEVIVKNNSAKNQLQVNLKLPTLNLIHPVLNRIKEMFDLAHDPIYVNQVLQRIPALKKYRNKLLGTRLVRCWDRFEVAVTTILGQLISVKHATQLTKQLIEIYGRQKINPWTQEKIILFPTAEILANSNLADLKIPQIKKQAIIKLAQYVLHRTISFSSYQDPQEFKQRLLEIRGIGRWTAEYIALRAIGDTDAFPSGDVYLNKLITADLAEKMAPWRGYLVSYLYKNGVQQ